MHDGPERQAAADDQRVGRDDLGRGDVAGRTGRGAEHLNAEVGEQPLGAGRAELGSRDVLPGHEDEGGAIAVRSPGGGHALERRGEGADKGVRGLGLVGGQVDGGSGDDRVDPADVGAGQSGDEGTAGGVEGHVDGRSRHDRAVVGHLNTRRSGPVVAAVGGRPDQVIRPQVHHDALDVQPADRVDGRLAHGGDRRRCAWGRPRGHAGLARAGRAPTGARGAGPGELIHRQPVQHRFLQDLLVIHPGDPDVGEVGVLGVLQGLPDGHRSVEVGGEAGHQRLGVGHDLGVAVGVAGVGDPGGRGELRQGLRPVGRQLAGAGVGHRQARVTAHAEQQRAGGQVVVDVVDGEQVGLVAGGVACRRQGAGVVEVRGDAGHPRRG